MTDDLKKPDDVMAKEFDNGLGHAHDLIIPELASVLGSLGKTGESDQTAAIGRIAEAVSATTGHALEVMSEEDLVALIKKLLPPEILENAANYVKLMKPTARAGHAMTGAVPYREYLRENVFMPNFRKFIEMVKETALVRNIEKFVQENQCVVSLNLHQVIFDQNAWAITPEYDGSVRTAYREYVDKMSSQPDFVRNVMGWPGATGTTKKLNGMVFERAALTDKIALKVLDNIFGGDWDYGSTLELGDRSVFKTGSFETALADRIRFAQLKWTAMCDEDKKAWLAGKFTHSAEAGKGRYDLVNIAAPNRYVG